MPCAYRLVLAMTAILLMSLSTVAQADDLKAEATTALNRAVDFFSTRIARHGGYVYRYSDDLSRSEGEGKTNADTVWVQPPGTPAVGMAYLEAWQRTGNERCLKAALATANCLRQGQLQSGGWQDRIEFGEERAKQLYRTNERSSKRAKNNTSFDDDKTQSVLRFLIRLDQALKFRDESVHEPVMYALNAILKAQRPNGGWPQVFTEPARQDQYTVAAAAVPESWSRTYPGGDYWQHTTLNDNALADTLEVLWLAAETYPEQRFREAAIRGGKFLVAAQLPAPQAGWAQQYNAAMEPAWARKFEPPAVSAGESQGVITALIRCYVETGDRAFLRPVEPALDWLDRSRLPDGQLARFYELKTNKPLYFTREYSLTYDDADLPTHYGFKVSSKTDSLRKKFVKVSALSPEKLARERLKAYLGDKAPPAESEVRLIISSLDDRGAWVEEGRLKYHGKGDPTRKVIESETFVRNLTRLSQFLDSRKE